MTESKKHSKYNFWKKKLPNDCKSPMFKSPSHYWNASQTGFLHSKGSANVELSIDPFNKALIRIFCQSIDQMVNYKSIEYNPKTTMQQVIEKMIKVLRLNKKNEELILCESVGRCMALNSDGSTSIKISKGNQPSIFIEQNRRMLMSSDYIYTILNFWKPMTGFSRRFELCWTDKCTQMSPFEVMTDSGIDNNIEPVYLNRNGSLSSISQRSFPDFENRSTQTDVVVNPPVAPRRKMSIKNVLGPHLLILQGENDINHSLMIPINDFTELGTTGSTAEVCLKRLLLPEKQIICVFSRDNSQSSKNNSIVYFKNVCDEPNLFVRINGDFVTNKIALNPGDIIHIGDCYSFYFKDNSVSGNYRGLFSRTNESEMTKQQSNGIHSDPSDHAVTSSSISSCSDINLTNKDTMKKLKNRKKVSIDLSGITLSSFDMALNQVIIHYFDDRMDLEHSVAFTLYLIRFCRESTRCSFTVEEMQDRMTKRFCKTLENAFDNDMYMIGNMKLTALGFQTWMVYHNENYIETTEENRQWLHFLETFTSESFNHLSSYICENAGNMSLCFFDENPFVNIDQQQIYKNEEDISTMERFLDFLSDICDKISKILCPKTAEIFKRVITSRIIIALTESTVTILLSEMDTFSWNRGVQISAQLEKFEDWLKTEGQFDIYLEDGFLHDFSKLVSTRSTVLREMNWHALRQSYRKIPASILRQFLSALIGNDSQAMKKWQPPQNELFESSQDVGEVLSKYLLSSDSCTLFQPGIILQIDCFPIDKVIQSVEFISLCTVLDTELIAMTESFQWMALPKPPSLVNFKNGRWVALRQSIGEDNVGNLVPSTLNRRHVYASEKIHARRKHQADSDYSSSSYKGEVIPSHKTIVAKYLLHKSNVNMHSKSLVSLNESDTVPKPPRRKKYKGSIVSLAPVKPSIYNDTNSSTNGSKSRGSVSGKSCSGQLGRSASFGSDLSPTPVIVNVNIDNISLNDVSDVDRTIDEMERALRMSDPLNKLGRLNFNSSLSPSTENGYYDDDDEDQMSMGLSANEMTSRLHSQSRSSDALLNIDEAKTVEITLKKSSGESYGITIADGMQTSLKKEGIFICKIARNSPAQRSERIKPGDQILEINNYSVDQLNFSECLMLMTKSLTSLKLLLEKADLQRTIQIMNVYQ